MLFNFPYWARSMRDLLENLLAFKETWKQPKKPMVE